MTDAERVRDRVSWQDRLPWLILLQAFRPAVSLRMLLWAAAGLIVMIAGWRLGWLMFAGSTDPLIVGISGSMAANTYELQDQPNQAQTVWPAWPWETAQYSHLGSEKEGVIGRVFGSAGGQLPSKVWQITLPFQLIFYGRIGWTGLAFCLLCGLWSLAVWAFFGGAMTRNVALSLTRQEVIPCGQTHNFALRHWLDYFTAPLYPLLGVLLLTLLVGVLGVVARIDVGSWIAAILWPLALLAGFLMAALLLGLFFGWPLMFSTVSVEGNDAFDALSRSYAYVFQRPLHYLFYGIVAAVLGTLGYFLVAYFAEAVIHLANWAASWGSGNARMSALTGLPDPTKLASDSYAAGIFAFWHALVRLIAAGFAMSYLWSATTAVYLLLRRDVDAAEMDEVQLEQDERFGLPPLATDESGVPGVADVPGSGTEKSQSEDE